MAADSQSILEDIKQLLSLLLNDIRLSATEKLSRLITAFALGFIVALLGLGVLLFLSYSMAAFFSTIMPTGFACMIVAGMYLIFIILAVIFRKAMIENPITRLLSKVILSKPLHNTQVLKPVNPEQNEK